jgi:malate/lactate dehydrogenase
MENIFDCDMLLFCVTAGVAEVGSEKGDVRLAQLESNSKIIDIYSKHARNYGFKGIFAVMSDPVDLLCKAAFLSSNKDEAGNTDMKGLAPEQIRGYGLGVMNA